MSKMRILFGFLFCAVASSLAIAQSSSGLRLYDNFNQNLIDPAKWVSGWQCNPGSTECERSIQNNRLRLRVRGAGSPSSNTGTQYGTSELFLASPAVSDIQAQVVVSKAKVESCSANPSWVHSQFLMWGAFFNSGDGSANDDVKAYLQIDKYPNESADVLHAGGFFGYRNQWSNFDLGPVNIGEKVTVELLWDQPGSRFVLRLFRPSIGIRYEQYMPYSMAVTGPAANPNKALSVNMVPPNCQGTRPVAEVEAFINEVRTN